MVAGSPEVSMELDEVVLPMDIVADDAVDGVDSADVEEPSPAPAFPSGRRRPRRHAFAQDLRGRGGVGREEQHEGYHHMEPAMFGLPIPQRVLDAQAGAAGMDGGDVDGGDVDQRPPTDRFRLPAVLDPSSLPKADLDKVTQQNIPVEYLQGLEMVSTSVGNLAVRNDMLSRKGRTVLTTSPYLLFADMTQEQKVLAAQYLDEQ